MSNKLRSELLMTTDFLSVGEVMPQEFAAMSWESLVCMICGATSSNLQRLAIVAMKLAQELDSRERL